MNAKEVVKIYNEAKENLDKNFKVVEEVYVRQKDQVFNNFADGLRKKLKDLDFETMLDVVEGDELDMKAKVLISNIFTENSDNKSEQILSVLTTMSLLAFEE